MPAVARVTNEGVIDVAGTGAITTGETSVTANGLAVAVIGSVIAAHSSGPNSHPASTVTGGSATVKAGGIAVARIGDTTSDVGAPTLVNIVGPVSDVTVG